MAVVQADIKADLVQLAADMKASELSDDAWADKLATIIKDAILSAEIDDLTTTANGVTVGGASVPVTGGLK